MSYSEVITYNSATALSFDSTKVTVTGGHLTLYGSAPYTTTNPMVSSQHQNMISSLTSFVESSTLAAGTAVKYHLVLNAGTYWYNATNGVWESSDGTYAKANTAAEINSHASALFTDLHLLTSQFLGLNIFLSTTNTSNAPILTSNTIGYTWTNSNSTAINQCLITGYLADLSGNLALPSTTYPTSLVVGCDRGFFHGSNFIEPFSKTFSFSTSTGYVSASVIETATPGVKLSFSVTFWDGQSVQTTKLFNAVVPNQPQVSLQNLSSVVPYNFG